jgi:alpha-1,3-rhamnosyl/mannosyltransferase
MRIIINAGALSEPLSGIGRYVAELIAAMPAEIEVVPFRGRQISAPAAAGLFRSGLRIGRQMPGARALAGFIGQHAFTAQARRCQPDVYHEPGFLAHSFDGPLVVTAHDASWVRHPETHPPARVRRMNAKFPAVLARADRVIVDSAFVGTEMRTLFGVQPEKLRVIPLGVATTFRPMNTEETRAVLDQLGVSHGRYLLAVGTLEPRKNLKTLLQAFGMLPRVLRDRFPLVVVGMQGWNHGEVDAILDQMRQRGEVRLVGHVSDPDLAILYAGATLFVYPSLYEGFGLPPLEAMASGVPVVVSDRASLPEVVGEAGRQVAALDITALAATLIELLEDPAARATLAAAGNVRAKTFTWEACARRTAAVYAELSPP